MPPLKRIRKNIFPPRRLNELADRLSEARRLNDVVDRINMGEDVYGFELELLADFVSEHFAEPL